MLANSFILSAADRQSTLILLLFPNIFWDETLLEPQVEHFLSCFGVESYEQEGEWFFGCGPVHLEQGILVVDPTELLAQRHYFLMIAQPPHALALQFFRITVPTRFKT